MRRLVCLLALSLASCVTYSLVAPGRVEIGEAYTVQPGVAWNRIATGQRERWTVDGPRLQDLVFFKGLADGETLFPVNPLARMTDKAKRTPRFRARMTALEIQEFVAASLAFAGHAQVRTKDLLPARFGTADGFRFAFSYALQDGLEKRGFAVGRVRNEGLDLILYRGTRLYYYGKYADEAERIVRSIRLL